MSFLDDNLSPLRWQDDALLLLDQRLLPNEEKWLTLSSYEDVCTAIRELAVRGAPAIGCAAAYGVALGLRKVGPGGMARVHAELLSTRPTAVNLSWALERMRKVPLSFEALLAEAHAIKDEDLHACRTMGALGAPLLPDGGILTHCNAGALATGGYGTALGVIRAAVAQGRAIRVFADETRPVLQGARLTAWELQRSGIDVTIITDSMAAHLMATGEIKGVVVGADRIARNGDTANKIGTYSVALAAAAHGLPFLVAAPWSTVDLACESGAHIPIEERSADEVTHHGGRRLVPEGVRVRNPAFDVTPARYLTAIVTERGIAGPPFVESLTLLRDKR
ncbi:MAG: S-methyl-5-thioribose-1-phosphate isomerase [Polyangia bacterium]